MRAELGWAPRQWAWLLREGRGRDQSNSEPREKWVPAKETLRHFLNTTLSHFQNTGEAGGSNSALEGNLVR